jgi:uncharacterized membrane protein
MAVTDTARGHSTAYGADLSASAIIVGLALLAAVAHFVMPFNHDEAYFIEAAGRLLDGGRFGKDIVDMNPPHVYWFSAIPVWLARQIGARSDIVATIFIAVMAALSLMAVNRLIAHDRSAESATHALPLAAAIVVLFAPGYDFGQREHWMVLLTLPYIIARSRRADGKTLSSTAAVLFGVAACFGFCIKPFYLLVPVALEIWLLARTRRAFVWISPETIAMVITGVVYLGFVVAYTPNYFKEELPNVLLGYWAFKSTLSELLRTAAMLTVPAVALAWLGYSTLSRGERIPTLAQAFAVAGVAFLIAALVQMKPWPYHFLPAVIFFDLAAAVLLVSGHPRPGTSTIRIAAFFVLIAVGFSPSAAEVAGSFDRSGTKMRVEQLTDLFRSHPGPNGTMAGFLTSPRDVYPAVIAAGMKWAVPFCCDYLIAASVRADEAPAAKRRAIKAAGLDQAKRVIAAMRAKEPGVMVIDAGNSKLGFADRKFDYVQWLTARTDFADILRHYREISPIGPFRIFVRM